MKNLSSVLLLFAFALYSCESPLESNAVKPNSKESKKEETVISVTNGRAGQNYALFWADITNPSDDLKLSSTRSAIKNDDEYNVDGWTNIDAFDKKWCKADLYHNGRRIAPYSTIRPYLGSWSKTVELIGGVNEFYLSSGCGKEWVPDPQDSSKTILENVSFSDRTKFRTPSRYLFFIPKIKNVYAQENEGKIKVEWDVHWVADYGSKKGFKPYFQIWRNTVNATTGGTWHNLKKMAGVEEFSNNWGGMFYDTDVQAGVTYYYFIQPSMNENSFPSNEYSVSASASVPLNN